MASSGAAAMSGWYTSFTTLSFVPPEYHYILRMVSWFFVRAATPFLHVTRALYIVRDRWKKYTFLTSASAPPPLSPQMTLAIIPLAPLILLLLYDLVLYIWRLYLVRGRVMPGRPVKPDHHPSATQTSYGPSKPTRAGSRAIPNGSDEKEKFG